MKYYEVLDKIPLWVIQNYMKGKTEDTEEVKKKCQL